jgi:polyhydroxyalkanoate synthesis regulator phasin
MGVCNTGKRTGKIRTTRTFLKRPVQTVEEPAQKPMAELKERLQELEIELAKLN